MEQTTPIQLTPEQKALVEKNLGLAQYLALNIWRQSRQEMEKHEVVAIGYQGLCTAALKFDPSMMSPETVASGKAFAGFARQRIVGAIMDWQRTRDHVPRRQRRAYKNLQLVGLGTGRSAEQLSDITGMPIDKIREITRAVEATSVSLDSPPDYWDDTQYAVELTTHQDVEGSILENNIMSSLAQTLEQLPELQQVVIALRYYEGHELIYIAGFLGIRLATIREAHSEAVLAIHDVMLKEAS